MGGQTTTYTYSDNNELLSGGGLTYSYDGAGNLAGSSQGLSAGYNSRNQMTSVTPPGGSQITMQYQDFTSDRRILAGGTRMNSTQLGLSSQGPDNGQPHQSWFVREPEGTLVSMVDKNDATKDLFYLFDGLGSVAATTSQSGSLVRRYTYEPYGTELSPSSTDQNPWRFASGYFDAATGMLKFGTRYYMPDLGRWTQRDPVMGGLSSPLSLNPYLYVGSDPVNLTDPSGRIAFLLAGLIGVGVGVLVGAGLTALGLNPVASAGIGGCAGGSVAVALTGPTVLAVVVACVGGALLGAAIP